jgi:hypothetical protein
LKSGHCPKGVTRFAGNVGRIFNRIQTEKNPLTTDKHGWARIEKALTPALSHPMGEGEVFTVFLNCRALCLAGQLSANRD